MIIKIKKIGILLSLSLSLMACEATNPPAKSEGHIQVKEKAAASIPEIIKAAPALPKPEHRESVETYTVIVNDVPVRELLFSMARDADINIDIDSDITGMVSMNAIDQSLPKILDRLARQVDINYRLEDGTLHVMVDTPYVQIYNISYLNMSRVSSGTVTVSTEISSTGGSGGGGNNSSTSVKNDSTNDFWKTLATNISSFIVKKEEVSDTNETGVKSGEEKIENIIVNREAGIMAIRATSRQHIQITEFIDKVLGSSHRQVLIEATIAEVTLSDHYQAGIDWSSVGTSGTTTTNIAQSVLGGNVGTTPFFSANLTDVIGGNQLNVTLKALETFGDVKVLSSPKIMALNNQTSMLKVVDNEVYFSIDVTPAVRGENGVVTTDAIIETSINTIPVGFVMSVTPFIDENDVVTLNVRPTISRIVSRINDPNPELANANVVSEVPIVQVREIESVLKINNGDTAVIGGLMQDQINKQNSGVPILSSLPFIGSLFSYQDDEYVKSELVIFIKPVVIHDASLTGDLKDYRKYLLEDLE